MKTPGRIQMFKIIYLSVLNFFQAYLSLNDYSIQLQLQIVLDEPQKAYPKTLYF